MICFRDMTFCSAYDRTCNNGNCFRALTVPLRKVADKWWSGEEGGAPIALSDFSKDCPMYKPNYKVRNGTIVK